MMKKFLVIFGIVVVVVAGTAMVLVANLDKVVDSKKDYILEQAETALGRDVTIGDIGVTLSRGIGVKLSGVAIADDADFSNEQFVSAKDLTVRVKLWPLFKKQIQIKRLVLNEPVISVIRREDGVLNFTSMLPAAAASGTGDAGGAEVTQAPPPAAASLVLAFADIRNGLIRYSDRAKGVDWEVKRIDFTAKNAGLGEVASLRFAAAVLADEQNVKVEGTVGPVEAIDTPADLAPTPVYLEASVGAVVLDHVRRVVPDHPKLHLLDFVQLGDIRSSFKITGTLGALELSHAEVVAAVLGAEEPNLSVLAQAGPIDLTAAASDRPAVAFTGRAELHPISLEKLNEKTGSAGAAPPDVELGGTAVVTVDFERSSELIELAANVDLTAGTVRLGEQFDKPADVPMRLTSRVAVSPTSANIHECTLTLDELILTAGGSVDLTGESPVLDVQVRSKPTDLAGLASMLPALAPFSLGGTLELAAKASGALEQGKLPNVEGSAQLEDGSAKLEQMPQPVTGAKATVKFTQGSARIVRGNLNVGQSSVRIDGTAKSLRPLDATYRITSLEAHRSDFHAPPKPAPRPEVLYNVKVEGRLRQDGGGVRHEASASSHSGTLANLDYRNLTASIASTADRVDIRRFSAETLGGTVEGSGAFLPKAAPPKFEITTRVRKVDLTDYFTYKFKSLASFIEGTIDADLDLAGNGKQWDEIRPTLTGKGGAVVIQGALLNVNIANELLSGLEQLPLVDRNAINRVRRNNPKLFSGGNTAFQDLRGEVRIEGGKIHSQGLVLRAPDYSIFAEGWVSLDRRLNLKTNIVFSPQATQNIVQELSVAKYLANDKGQLEFPVTLSGPLTRPSIVPDLDALSKKIQDSAVDQGIDKLRNQVDDQVKDFLKGIGTKKSRTTKDTSGS